MGTNFYYRINICEHCDRYEQVHVGKRSAGWSFGFRAWPHRLMNADYPEWGYDPASPFGFEVMSRADWRKAFTEHPGKLFDEYGREGFDPIGWLDALEPPDDELLAREDSMRTGPHWLDMSWHKEREWRDPEGFHFGAYEFS